MTQDAPRDAPLDEEGGPGTTQPVPQTGVTAVTDASTGTGTGTGTGQPTPPAKHLAAGPGPRLYASPPRTTGAVAFLGIVLSVVIVGAGLVLIHDALVLFDVIKGEEWITAAAKGVGTIEPNTVVAWIGLGIAVVGLLVLLAAVMPRRRAGLPLRIGEGLYLREQDVARLASGTAQGVGGVLEANSAASRRVVVVRVRTTIDVDVADRTREAVTERLAIMANPPRVRIRAKGPRR